jgi:DNA-binding transcriptional MerR regulator
MSEINTTKKHLLVKRAKMIKFLKNEGYNGEEIGEIFNIDRSQISRILIANEKYKKFVRKQLSDLRPKR